MPFADRQQRRSHHHHHHHHHGRGPRSRQAATSASSCSSSSPPSSPPRSLRRYPLPPPPLPLPLSQLDTPPARPPVSASPFELRRLPVSWPSRPSASPFIRSRAAAMRCLVNQYCSNLTLKMYAVAVTASQENCLMRAIAADVARSVVCLFVGHDREPCINGCTDRDAFWETDYCRVQGP